MEPEKKIRKGKVVLIVIVAIILIVAIVTIVSVIKKHSKEGEEDVVQEKPESVVIELPNTTYSDMEVSDIGMEYLKDNDETLISMTINNTTERTVSKESLTAILLNNQGETVGEMPTYIEQLGPNEQYSISVVLKGDLTSTSSIRLQQDETQAPETQTPENNQVAGNQTTGNQTTGNQVTGNQTSGN